MIEPGRARRAAVAPVPGDGRRTAREGGDDAVGVDSADLVVLMVRDEQVSGAVECQSGRQVQASQRGRPTVAGVAAAVEAADDITDDSRGVDLADTVL